MRRGSGDLSGRQALELLARLGYGARGVTYCLVGGLAVLAAIGIGGQTGGSRSALLILLERPFGWILLGIVAFGLAAFALWRVVEAVTDADHYGRSAKGLANCRANATRAEAVPCSSRIGVPAPSLSLSTSRVPRSSSHQVLCTSRASGADVSQRLAKVAFA